MKDTRRTTSGGRLKRPLSQPNRPRRGKVSDPIPSPSTTILPGHSMSLVENDQTFDTLARMILNLHKHGRQVFIRPSPLLPTPFKATAMALVKAHHQAQNNKAM